MKAVCPKDPSHDRFVTVAHVAQDWVVDPEGEFVSVDADVETTHGPDPDNTWTCRACGAEAEVEP